MVYKELDTTSHPGIFENDDVNVNHRRANFSDRANRIFIYKTHIKKANVFYKKGDLIEAYYYFGIAKNISACLLWHEAETHCLMLMGSINTAWEKYETAYKNYMSCLNLILDKDLNSSLSLIYFKLSDYYKTTKQPKLSKTYNEKAINSLKKTTLLE